MLPLKIVHVACVLLSGLFFFVRGLWMLSESPLLQARWVKIVPHVIDATLLFTALALAWKIQQYPFVHAWLTAKVLGLLAYIVLGTVALKRGKTKAIRTIAWVMALITFGYILWVARTHNPLPFVS